MALQKDRFAQTQGKVEFFISNLPSGIEPPLSDGGGKSQMDVMMAANSSFLQSVDDDTKYLWRRWPGGRTGGHAHTMPALSNSKRHLRYLFDTMTPRD